MMPAHALRPVPRGLPPSPADRLRDIARRIRRLGVSGRCDPEAIVVAKHELAAAVLQVAAEVDRA
jgi:hypothetical protein